MKKILVIFSAVFLLIVLVCLVKSLSLVSLQRKNQAVKLNSTEVAAGAAEHLSQAVQIKTISHEQPENSSAQEFLRLHELINNSFPLVRTKLQREVINQYSLLYKWQGQDESLKPGLFLAHLDVVPVEPGTDTQWKHPPFEGVIADGYVWGRGAIDDKVNVIGLLEAAENLLGRGFQPKRTVYFAFGHDEEISGLEGAAKIVEHLAAKKVSLDFVMDEGLFILDGMLPGIERPVAYIGVAEKGYLDLELSVKSAGGHSSKPPAETAVGVLSKAISTLENQPFPASLDGAVASMFRYAAPEMSGALRIVFANQWMFGPLIKRVLAANPVTNALIRTTAAPTMLSGSQKANVMPAVARAVVNFRVQPGESVASTIKTVRETIDDERVEVKELPGANEPVDISSLDNEIFRNIQEALSVVFPDAISVPALMIGGTDSKHFKSVTDNIYRFSPMYLTEEELDGFHGTNERLGVDNLGKIISYYALLLERM